MTRYLTWRVPVPFTTTCHPPLPHTPHLLRDLHVPQATVPLGSPAGANMFGACRLGHMNYETVADAFADDAARNADNDFENKCLSLLRPLAATFQLSRGHIVTVNATRPRPHRLAA